jgi:hypothetical protein
MADQALMQAMRDAGEVIRGDAARRAAAWSHKIPPSGRVESVRDDEVLIIFGGISAPNAYPFEVRGVRHPVFGRSGAERTSVAAGTGHGRGWTWVLNDWRPFLTPAAEENADKAASVIATVVDKWGRELGFI